MRVPVPAAVCRSAGTAFCSGVTISSSRATTLIGALHSSKRRFVSDIHITRELLRAMTRGELSERALGQIEAQHLENLCPVCKHEIWAWQEEQKAGAAELRRKDKA